MSTTEISDLVRRADQTVRKWWALGRPSLPDVPRWPCRLVLTGDRRNHGHGPRITVRCECMAETRGKPRPGFWGYDSLGYALSLQEAVELWERHRTDLGVSLNAVGAPAVSVRD